MDAYLRRGPNIEITTDASPWGIGGWVSIDGFVTELFSDPLGDLDVAEFGHEIGSAEGQQSWEALAILVALRLWRRLWLITRAVIVV